MVSPDPLYQPEAMLVAAVLYQPDQFERVSWVKSELIDSIATRDVWTAIRYVLKNDKITDGDVLLSRVRTVLVEYGKSDALTRLMKLTDTYPALGVLADNYARAVHEQGQRAQLASAAVRMTQIVNSDLDMDEMVDLLEQAWVETLASAHAEPGWKPIDGLSTVNEFVTGSDEVHEWVIPGLLERQERLMLVAPEKAGKSVLTRQVALMLAAGRHPFSTSSACPPMTTLMIDLENPAPTARRDFRRQIDALEGLWSTENDRAYLWHKPAGIHLGDRADRVALFQVVERVQPDLLCICPIYKAYDGLEQSWEQQAQGVQKPLDRLREEFNLALWLEHHAPWGEKGMREIRAIGSSRWARWLDYQVSLEPTGSPPYQRLTWKSVRRDERKMAPASLVRGGPGEPSWIPEWADGGNLGFDLAIHESEL